MGPRVAHVDTERGFSGGQVQVFLLLQGLRERGVRNVLFCPPGSAAEARARELGLDVRAVPMRNDADLAAILRLARAFAEVDLVHAHTGRANALAGIAAWRARRPAITTRRMDGRVRRHMLNRWLYGRVFRRAVAISGPVAAQLAAGGVPVRKIVTIRSSVDVARLSPSADRATLRARLSLPDDEVVLLAAAHLTERKGLDVAMRALAAVGDDIPRWRLLVAGEGPARPALEELVQDLVLGDRVTFIGARDDVPDLLHLADAFLMPSRAEGLGVAALEAMAAGRAVLASAVGGLAEAVVDGVTGRRLPPDDVAAWTAALRELLSDAALRASLGAAGPARIADAYSSERMVAAYARLYAEVLSEGR